MKPAPRSSFLDYAGVVIALIAIIGSLAFAVCVGALWFA